MEQKKPKDQQGKIGSTNGFPLDDGALSEPERDQAELNFLHHQKKQYLRKRIFKIGAIVFVVGSVVVAASFLVFGDKKNIEEEAIKKEISVPVPEDKDHVFVNDGDTAATAESDAKDAAADANLGLAGKSENYSIKDIVFGGNTMVLAGEEENFPLEILNVHTETLLSKDGKTVKMLISWQTNKLSRADVMYRKDGSSGEKVLREEGYGFSHALVMNKLEMATRYSFLVEAHDRQGNSSKSDTLAAYTGSKPMSVFDLISGEMDEIFGWAIN